MAQDENILEVLTPARREEIRNGLTQPQKDAYDVVRNKFDKVKNSTRDRNDVNLEVLDSYESMWLKKEVEKKEKHNELITQNASPEAIKNNLDSIDKRYENTWQKKAKEKYGLGGQMAFNALAEINKPTGIIEGITKNVYDKNDKGPIGGLQIGGILGAIGGVLLGMMGGNMLGGGWGSIIAIVGGALLGSWLGNKGGDMLSGMFNKKETGPSAEPSQSQGLGQSQQIEGETPEQKSIRLAQEAALRPAEKKDAPKKDVEHVDNAQGMQLATPPVPTKPVQLPDHHAVRLPAK